MTKDALLKRLRELETETSRYAVQCVIAFIEDGRSVEDALLKGVTMLAREAYAREDALNKYIANTPTGPMTFIFENPFAEKKERSEDAREVTDKA